ncbi:MAG: FAD-dependent oxidoreductase [Candidatus Omnitrophica bacterium]|nr:FAD-dependent oxidoreductase [Candidatus Omnitrophota bacterium]
MKLLEPITIRGVKFKNRVVMLPMLVGMGFRGSRSRAYYGERARGGVGAIIMAGVSVDVFANDEAWGKPGGVEAFLEGVRGLTDDIHRTGAKIGVQFWHGNRFPAGTGTPQDTRGALVAPSAVDDKRALTVDEMQAIIGTFAAGAANARKAGLDFVEVHGAHGYLVCQFFSGGTNHRQDKYGGDLTGRMRFGTELVAAMRTSVGNSYPLFYRIGAVEDIPGGITLEESVRFAGELEKAGIDVIDISLGRSAGTGGVASPEAGQPEGTFVPYAEAIKRRVKIPVIGVGRIKSPQVAEKILADGKADMIGIGRQLIADPYWMEKTAGERIQDIIPCISCNTCSEPRATGGNLRCSVNAATGKEADFAIEPAQKSKKVMVVGGGPAGMEAARVATLRGHKVTLYEKQKELGGQLIPAAVPPNKEEIGILNRYLAYQLKKNGVQVKLGVEVTPQLIEKEKPDAVIVATGSVPMTPDIPGISKNRVVTAVDVLTGGGNVGKEVVVIGGELVGCETADFLSDQGKKVTVVRRGAQMAAAMVANNRRALLNRLKEKNVTLMPGVKEYKEITKEGLVLVDSEGKQRTLKADTIVLATGAISDDRLSKAIEGKVSEIHVAGDCVEPRRIVDAIYDGARLARAL